MHRILLLQPPKAALDSYWFWNYLGKSFDFNLACFHLVLLFLLLVCSDEPTGRLALVFELMEMNLYEAIKGRTTYLPESRVKFYIY